MASTTLSLRTPMIRNIDGTFLVAIEYLFVHRTLYFLLFFVQALSLFPSFSITISSWLKLLGLFSICPDRRTVKTIRLVKNLSSTHNHVEPSIHVLNKTVYVGILILFYILFVRSQVPHVTTFIACILNSVLYDSVSAFFCIFSRPSLSSIVRLM